MLFVFVAWLTVPVTGLRFLLATVMGAASCACQKRWLSSVHAISTWPAACAGLACAACLARPDSQSLCCTRVYFLCDILWPEVQSHFDSSHMPATGPCSARALTQARPTMSCIHLVYMQTCVESCHPVAHHKEEFLPNCPLLPWLYRHGGTASFHDIVEHQSSEHDWPELWSMQSLAEMSRHFPHLWCHNIVCTHQSVQFLLHSALTHKTPRLLTVITSNVYTCSPNYYIYITQNMTPTHWTWMYITLQIEHNARTAVIQIIFRSLVSLW